MMDRVFLEYYEDELHHIRTLAREFAVMHPAVARNLSLEETPCPDPYVERLLEGVAFLAARTRLKVDGERSRFARNILDALYPDLVGPAPAVSTVDLQPGPQVETMLAGHVVPRGTRLVSGLREGLTTRASYTTTQDVTLWPVKLAGARYMQDRGAMIAAGLGEAQLEGAEAAISLTLARSAHGNMAELALDGIDLHFADRGKGGRLFDAIFGRGLRVLARPAKEDAPLHTASMPGMVGIADDEALLPRSRPSFEGYRLLREYFLMPERFHYARLAGLGPAVRKCSDAPLEILILLSRETQHLADLKPGDFRIFATPVANLFERECNIVELDPRKPQQVLDADRTRTRDFEIYRLTRVQDADREGTETDIPPLFSIRETAAGGAVYATERRPRRPGEDEIRQQQMRTSYGGDNFFISLSYPPGAAPAQPVRRLDARALCTNRDLPILDDEPQLTLSSGDPVSRVVLLDRVRPPRPSLPAALPKEQGGESRLDDLSWRLIGQLSLNFLSLAEESKAAEPLRALLNLYADRGDPALARHARSITAVRSRGVVDRLAIAGPICFGHGVEITLHVDEAVLSGHSRLLLSALLNQLFVRYAGINSFVRTRTHLTQSQEDVSWPMKPGNRWMI